MALEGTNSVVDVVPNAHRYSILQDGDGLFLSSADGELTFIEHVDDSAVWDAAEGGQYKHPLTGAVVDLAEHGVTAEWGPESLPSAYLEHLVENGHVCMPALIAPENCLALQQLASEPSDLPMVMRSPLGIGVSSHPVAMWVIKSYLRSDYKLAHSPGFAILKPGLGIDGTGGWHSCEPAHAGLMHSCSAASADLSGAVRRQRLSVPPGHGAARRLPGVVRPVPVGDPVRPAVQHLHHRFHPRERT